MTDLTTGDGKSVKPQQPKTDPTINGLLKDTDERLNWIITECQSIIRQMETIRAAIGSKRDDQFTPSSR